MAADPASLEVPAAEYTEWEGTQEAANAYLIAAVDAYCADPLDEHRDAERTELSWSLGLLYSVGTPDVDVAVTQVLRLAGSGMPRSILDDLADFALPFGPIREVCQAGGDLELLERHHTNLTQLEADMHRCVEADNYEVYRAVSARTMIRIRNQREVIASRMNGLDAGPPIAAARQDQLYAAVSQTCALLDVLEGTPGAHEVFLVLVRDAAGDHNDLESFARAACHVS